MHMKTPECYVHLALVRQMNKQNKNREMWVFSGFVRPLKFNVQNRSRGSVPAPYFVVESL